MRKLGNIGLSLAGAAMVATATTASAQPGPALPLVAVPAAECAALSRQLSSTLPRPLVTTTGRVEFFSGDRRWEGRSCVLTARGSGTQFDRRPNAGEALQARIRAGGWIQDEGMMADGPGSSVIGFRRGDRVLSMSWEDDDGGLCGDGDGVGVDCERTPARRVVTVVLGLARDPGRR